jgi:hypothetical protein
MERRWFRLISQFREDPARAVGETAFTGTSAALLNVDLADASTRKEL